METRRNFIKKSSLGIVATASLNSNFMIGKNILGANDRIHCAIAGVRSRGKAHAAAIHLQKNAKILYSCDVDDTILDEHNQWSKENIGYVPKVEKILENSLKTKKLTLFLSPRLNTGTLL
jgi:hypothetical protein